MYLMNYVTPTLKLVGDYEHNINNNSKDKKNCIFAFVATSVEVLDESLMPFCLRSYVSSPNKLVEEFNSWFQRRIMTSKRKQQVDLIENYIFNKNPKILSSQNIDKIMFASVTDKYWLSKHNIVITKDEYDKKMIGLNKSLAQGNDEFGNLCFTQNPYILKNKDFFKTNNNTITFFNSYNYCLGGITNKRWLYNKHKNKLELVKQRNEAYGQEPINEIIATKMLKYFKFPHLPFVEYVFFIDGMELCSKCENFIGEKEELVPMSDIVRVLKKNPEHSMYTHVVSCLEFLEIPNASEYIDEMIIFDRLSLNFDRHLGNFGAIRDVETGQFTRMSPLFDFGSCCFFNYNNEIKTKDGKNNSRTLLFMERIHELEEQGKIPKLPESLIEILKTELNNYIYTSLDMDNHIINKMLEINSLSNNHKNIDSYIIDTKKDNDIPKEKLLTNEELSRTL